ncbi:MAG: hypothetical protein JW763_00960 [candidate division Zixibacteria bacterium]|nr:hypothetical protein [candidate division Zixibacteria bacterium]
MSDRKDNSGSDLPSYKTYFGKYYTITPFFKALTDDRTDSEVDQLCTLCGFTSEDRILDLGCGQGRHCTG